MGLIPYLLVKLIDRDNGDYFNENNCQSILHLPIVSKVRKALKSGLLHTTSAEALFNIRPEAAFDSRNQAIPER